MSNDEFRAEVVDALQSEPAARRSRIYVCARDGTVTLSGHVSSFSKKQNVDMAVTRAVDVNALDTQNSIKHYDGRRFHGRLVKRG